MKDKTVVEWLYRELAETKHDENSLREILHQAKAIHQEQIEDAFKSGKSNGYETATGMHEYYKHPSTYYNETYED